MSKKMELLEAASKVILSDGVNRFTLEAVADEANVSKGGLLYHYSTKEKLITAMNTRVIEQFRELIEIEVASGYSYHQAYLLATLNSLRNTEYLNVNASLLAAVSNDREILDLWKEEYIFLHEKFVKEKYKIEYSLLIQAACDGLWYSKLFNIANMETAEEESLIKYLLNLLEEDLA